MEFVEVTQSVDVYTVNQKVENRIDFYHHEKKLNFQNIFTYTFVHHVFPSFHEEN